MSTLTFSGFIKYGLKDKASHGNCKNALNFLNPSQTPVFTMDQPLYTIAKCIQWTWPELGEDKYVVA